MANESLSAGFNELLGRALTDYEFRSQLFEDRDEALREFDLNETDRSAIERLSREQLEEQASKLGGRSSMTIKVVISKSF